MTKSMKKQNGAILISRKIGKKQLKKSDSKNQNLLLLGNTNEDNCDSLNNSECSTSKAKSASKHTTKKRNSLLNNSLSNSVIANGKGDNISEDDCDGACMDIELKCKKSKLKTEVNSDAGNELNDSRIKKIEAEKREYVLEIFRLGEGRGLKKEIVCQVCEKSGDVVICSGPCLAGFHSHCVGLDKAVEGTFKCSECTSGNINT